jgi:hypothetical protein
MASEVKTNKVSPAVGTDVILGDASDTFTIPASVTLDVNGTIDVTGATTTGFPSAGFSTYTVVVASDTTFDLDSDTTKLIIEVQASGGTAGTASSGWYPGGAGGGGAYARKLLTGITGATDKLNITIGGVAGIAASGTTTSVAQAGTASFTTITCVGGAGGTTNTGATASGIGGAGGTLPTTGDFNVAGGDGGVGNSGRLIVRQGGAWFGRSNSLPTAGVGKESVGYGGGGGGGEGDSVVGGDGSPAVVIVTEYK